MNLLARYFFCFLSLLVSTHSSGQTANSVAPFYPGNAGVQGFDRTISFRYINGEIFITVTINGNEYSFIYDTGAITALSETVQRDMELEEVGSIKVSDGRTNTAIKKTYVIPTLEIGGIPFYNTLAIATDLKNIGLLLGARVDGIIGANLMRLAGWTIDFENKTLRFTDKAGLKDAQAQVIPFIEGPNGSPYIVTQYGDSSFYAEFDTGSNNPFAIDDSVYFNNSTKEAGQPAMAYGELEQSVHTAINSREYRTVSNNLKLGSIPVKNVLINIRDLKDAIPTIGTPFMENYTITLDWGQHMIYLNKKTDKLNERFTTSLGLSAAVKEGQLKVALVWKGSKAEAYGITPGDNIIAINGKNVSQLENEEYIAVLEQMRRASAVAITINKNGMDNTYELTRYSLIR